MPRQTSTGNVLARTSSSGSGSSVVGSPHPSLGSANSNRQSSQGSLFEQFATQAKELVKETKRQSSQDGLLAQVDKVSKNSSFIPKKICLCKCLYLCDKFPLIELAFCICVYGFVCFSIDFE